MILVVLCFPGDGVSSPLLVLIVVSSILLAWYAVNDLGLRPAVGKFFFRYLLSRNRYFILAITCTYLYARIFDYRAHTHQLDFLKGESNSAGTIFVWALFEKLF